MAAPTIDERRGELAGQEVPIRYLVVMGPNVNTTHTLPLRGSILIGRAEDAPVRLIDPAASRAHAALHLEEPRAGQSGVALEDLGGANGTFVREARIPPHTRVPLAAGEAFTIGSTVLMVRLREPALAGPRLWPHGYFEVRLIEESARAASAHVPLGLARLHLEAPVDPDALTRAVGPALRSGDVLAAYGPRDLELLLVDSDRRQAEAACQRVEQALSAVSPRVRTGLASYPEDGDSPQALMSAACARVFGAGASPGHVLQDRAMRELYAVAERAAASTINILLLGETGVGKEVLARTIHERSPRASRPLVSINCAALSETLLESELFGHEKGAFTGAVAAKEGLLEAAAGGTVFLDEIGDMPIGLQTRLLRAIENKEVTRVGSTRPRPIDVRFVAATNHDLEDEAAQKTFRSDLYFRLAGFTLLIPPLRERPEEIEPLAQLFLEAAARRLGTATPSIGREARALLRAYAWPGNVRELRNVMERAAILCEGAPIGPSHLPAEKLAPRPTQAGQPMPAGTSWRENQEATERKAIEDALTRCAGNQSRAAELLGMPRRTFCAKLKEYAIPRPRV